ncbi:exo-beta-N-acetylmuramidase NamZ domain-containing protein [Flavobacterium sp. TAB 87]|uniref:exo-beta-N-acetylmuramidase NamZ family protein n=1 Tax=Flavobacterium sp. TAB 87 TaxID=1729581 RepID=UPI00076C7B79|nr:DUF1343 domain-containing protein [Flavobacterium sp. TAB 87]KVV15482.1 hypothetical protein AP058_01151 [Flavobacterium sp. TAB 87]
MSHFFKKQLVVALLFLCSTSYSCQGVTKTTAEKSTDNRIKAGADHFEKYLPLLDNKKVGIVTNQTGILTNKVHLVDFLMEKKIKVQTIFAPEHGFRGTADAGEHVVDGKDAQTGISIISLYGDNKKPKKEQLAKIDIMIFDLQDVGARFYTYISSLHYVMEACAELNIPLIILDRPNPNGGIIDGPLLEKECTSFVGMHPIPLLHGMTIGEYAQMINGEKWLKNGMQCKLKVIECSNYKRNMNYSLLVKPSPNLPNDQSINLYASLCLFEGTNVSVGRGTENQFQIYGSPFLPETTFSFIPKANFGAKDPLYNGKKCYGEDLTDYPKLKQLELKWLIKAYDNTADKSKFFNAFFTKLAGTKKLQKQIEEDVSEAVIRESWKQDLLDFKKRRSPYLLY